MKNQMLKELSNKKLIERFNDYLFNIKNYNQTKIIKELEVRNLRAYQAFPKLISALKRKTNYRRYLKILKQKEINQSVKTLKLIFFEAISRKTLYYSLEALGMLDWKSFSKEKRQEFKNFLEEIIDSGYYYDVFRFLARGIAYWHFKDEFEFDAFIGGSHFEKEDAKLMEPLILRMLEFSITNNNNYRFDSEAARLARILGIHKTIPYLKKACKRIHYVSNGVYDESKDWYGRFRLYSVRALTDFPNVEKDLKIKELLLEILLTDPRFDVVLEAIYSLNAYQSEDVIPYLKAIRHKSIGQFVTEPYEIDLEEALEFNLNKRNAQPKNYIESAAERIVYFKFITKDDYELTRFFAEFPVLTSNEYGNLFEQILHEVSYLGSNFQIYEDTNKHYANIARILLHLDPFLDLPDFIEITDKITDERRKSIANSIIRQMREERKKEINTEIAHWNIEERKHQMVLTNRTIKWINYSTFPEKFHEQINELVKQFHIKEISERIFYERILKLLYKTTLRVIGENEQDLKPASIVLIKNAMNTCLFLNSKEKQEILETIKELVYIDETN